MKALNKRNQNKSRFWFFVLIILLTAALLFFLLNKDNTETSDKIMTDSAVMSP